ncbi:cytochrome c oxidase subunit 6A2, mitochondrial-like [Adelges cooleyi]|uniref:cytochrome c oxidase subunit 6A2, mitochondrial-like n=1 Tax=Adelges cooleyi TaxID=133065 RepID=UPI00217F66AB|nr:cytochrome c oxidase subunit 6A2, mitochondrial-like [Adelges cooleyi]
MALRVFSRKFSSSKQLRAVIEEQFTKEKLNEFNKPEVLQGVKMWKNFTFYLALPGCLLASIYCIGAHLEHEKHVKRSEFVPYEHLRIRTRRFPWGNGDQTFFHNPKLNATSQGYEVDEEK